MKDRFQTFDDWQARINQVIRKFLPGLPEPAQYCTLIGRSFTLLYSLNDGFGRDRLFSLTGTFSEINAYQKINADGSEEDLILELFVRTQQPSFLSSKITKLIISEACGRIDFYWDPYPIDLPSGRLTYISSKLHLS